MLKSSFAPLYFTAEIERNQEQRSKSDLNTLKVSTASVSSCLI